MKRKGGSAAGFSKSDDATRLPLSSDEIPKDGDKAIGAACACEGDDED
jgi:hypothetical protein